METQDALTPTPTSQQQNNDIVNQYREYLQHVQESYNPREKNKFYGFFMILHLWTAVLFPRYQVYQFQLLER